MTRLIKPWLYTCGAYFLPPRCEPVCGKGSNGGTVAINGWTHLCTQNVQVINAAETTTTMVDLGKVLRNTSYARSFDHFILKSTKN